MTEIKLNKNIVITLKVLLCYVCLTLITGIVKNEMLLSEIDNSMRSFARFTSYLSLFIGSLFMFIMFVIVLIVPWFLLTLLNSHIEFSNYCLSTIVFVKVLIATELLRFSLLWIFLYDEKRRIIWDLSFKEQLANTLWFKLNTIFVFASIFMGAILFGWSLYRNGNVKFTDSLAASIVIVLFLALLSYKF